VDLGPLNPTLPDGVDEKEYRRIRRLMRVSVLSVWRANHEVIVGMDPWDVVDEAWSSMAQGQFQSKGPFLPHALIVARNKAVDALRRTEARRGDRSLDAPSRPAIEDGEPTTLHDQLADSGGADVDYLRGLDQVDAIQKLALAEEAIYTGDILTKVEREVFVAVRVDGKSRAAVGRELDPPITGQRVGQLAAQAFIKIQAYVRENEQGARADPNERRTEGEADGRD
jgi:DNA-directed RNA polymerase specialized sigma24 family protein